MTDVDINERLNGLVNLLHIVGIDGVDPDALVAEQRKLRGSATPTTSDAQILEIIRKLQLAQADSPEILAALKSPELRALASLAAGKQQAPKKPPPPSLDDVMDDDDNYPKIGPGYSDDISVVSDLTTPTVMTKQHIMEEEFYKDVNGGPGALPPMHIGLGVPARAPGFAPKTKNLVSQVKPSATRQAIAKTGGAAAQRRLNYQQAMAKLQSDYPVKQDKNYMEHFSPKNPKAPFLPSSPTPSKLPSELPSLADQGKKIKQTRNKAAVKEKKGRKTALAVQEEGDYELDYDPMAPKFDQMQEFDHVPGSGASASSGSRRKKERSTSQDIEWGGGGSGGGDSNGWPAFEEMGSKSSDVFVDNDGFFSSDAFGKTAAFSPTGKPKVRRDDGGVSKPRKPKGSKDGDKKEKEKDKKKTKSRRASLTM